MAETPEHEKLHKVRDKSQVCGEFLDWLRDEKGFTLATEDEYGDPIPVYTSTTKLLAEFFEIDLKVLEDEKEQMLRELRAAHANR